LPFGCSPKDLTPRFLFDFNLIGASNTRKKYRLKQQKEGTMQRMIPFTILLMALTACATPQATAGMPNPASVHCEQNGNQLEIRTAADGSQYGLCIFPDGSTCDEWAYYRGECGPATQQVPTSAVIVVATASVIASDPGRSGDAGENASGGYMPPGVTEDIADWWGVIRSTPPGAQYDDYFERQDLGQVVRFGIDSMNPAVKSQIEALRDTGRIVHLYGTLLKDLPDYNGSQIQVDRIEALE
jgi:putative hemolysin